LESLLADEDEDAGDFIPAGPVAEGVADSTKSPLLSTTGKSDGGSTGNKSSVLGNVMAMMEPTLKVTDPFLLGGGYRGTPQYMQGIDLARYREGDIEALCDKVRRVQIYMKAIFFIGSGTLSDLVISHLLQ
jgi:hypothetical protein